MVGMRYVLGLGVVTALGLSGCSTVQRAAGLVGTLCGGTRGYTDGLAASAHFDEPRGIVIDRAGTLYVADTFNHRIRRVATDGTVSTLAGGGVSGFSGGGLKDGVGETARFRFPRDLAIDPDGNLYVADTNNDRVRKIVPGAAGGALVTTLTGGGSGYQDGPGATARFHKPWGIACDQQGNVYVSDTYNHRVRKIDTHDPAHPVTTVGGSGRIGISAGGYTDGPIATSKFFAPRGVAVDVRGRIYVADASNQCIRRITQGVGVETLGGTLTPARRRADLSPLVYPTGLALAADGTLYAVDNGSHTIYRISDAGVATLLAGGSVGFVDGIWPTTQFHDPNALALDARGRLYVADTGNHRIRLVY